MGRHTEMRSYPIPDKVFNGWNWCKDLNDLLLSHIEDLSSKYVKDEVFKLIFDCLEFQCVNMLKFGEHYVFVDCNDCASWMIDPDLLKGIDFTYLKLQYSKRIKYPYIVKPFLYVSLDFSFYEKVYAYRLLYKTCIKKTKAYGRFRATNSRLQIAKEMSRLGIPGGLYCNNNAYEDSILDKESPKSRLSWDQYLQRMLESDAMIDAPGYGDLTHRLVECLGIGIPYIRPKLLNSMHAELTTRIHYLDCQADGSKLQECLEQLEDDNFRNNLIQNECSWFDDNLRPSKLKEIFYNLIGG